LELASDEFIEIEGSRWAATLALDEGGAQASQLDIAHCITSALAYPSNARFPKIAIGARRSLAAANVVAP
jgi:hypothetical protein